MLADATLLSSFEDDVERNFYGRSRKPKDQTIFFLLDEPRIERSINEAESGNSSLRLVESEHSNRAHLEMIDIIQQERQVLLAKKYDKTLNLSNEAKFSDEDNARLRHLTQLIEAFDPAVTPSEFNKIEVIAGHLQSIADELNEIRERFHIK
jgi:hypothetical protein